MYGLNDSIPGPRAKKSGQSYCKYFSKVICEKRNPSRICDQVIKVIARRRNTKLNEQQKRKL